MQYSLDLSPEFMVLILTRHLLQIMQQTPCVEKHACNMVVILALKLKGGRKGQAAHKARIVQVQS
jgi:hypothetical protein